MGASGSSASVTKMSSNNGVKSFVDGVISNYKVAVFSKDTCPYCDNAKTALNSFQLKPNAMQCVEINKRDDCQQIQDYLKDITGARSVPRVFINGKFLGGGDDTVKAKNNGTLEKLLREAEAI